jgi:hypothetical protein
MKSSNTIVTIVVIAAVLVAAYAVGMLIHQARTGNSPSGTEANDVRSETAMPHGPGGRTQDSPEARAKLKEKRAEALEKLESATEEQKTQFREEVRRRFDARPDKRPAQQLRQTPPMQPSPQDPNTGPTSEGTGSEPNAAGQS